MWHGMKARSNFTEMCLSIPNLHNCSHIKILYNNDIETFSRLTAISSVESHNFKVGKHIYHKHSWCYSGLRNILSCRLLKGSCHLLYYKFGLRRNILMSNQYQSDWTRTLEIMQLSRIAPHYTIFYEHPIRIYSKILLVNYWKFS